MSEEPDDSCPARALQESVLAGLLAERHQVEPPDLSGLTGPDRQRRFAEWANELPSCVPEGVVKLHHTAQTQGETARRYRKVSAREALQNLKSAGTVAETNISTAPDTTGEQPRESQ